MFNPLVSVIIPNYCHAKYLDQRIQSVINQTYQKFEVIILDDASPDDGASKAVIEKYRDNPHVSHIIYNEENSGSTFKQWNKGFKLANGKLIWIAESDDYCELNFLESLVPCWQEYPDCSVAFCTCRYVNANGTDRHPEICYSGKTNIHEGIEFIKYNLVNSCYTIPNASAVVFSKEIAMSIPSDYMQYKASGDRLFWIYMSEKGRVCQINLPLNNFRIHPIKVSQGKEADGTQCKENHKINLYLRSKGYIKGSIKLHEYVFYWDYITNFEFVSPEIKNELLKLWYPKWWMTQHARGIAGILLYFRSLLTRIHYEFIKKISL